MSLTDIATGTGGIPSVELYDMYPYAFIIWTCITLPWILVTLILCIVFSDIHFKIATEPAYTPDSEFSQSGSDCDSDEDWESHSESSSSSCSSTAEFESGSESECTSESTVDRIKLCTPVEVCRDILSYCGQELGSANVKNGVYYINCLDNVLYDSRYRKAGQFTILFEDQYYEPLSLLHNNKIVLGCCVECVMHKMYLDSSLNKFVFEKAGSWAKYELECDDIDHGDRSTHSDEITLESDKVVRRPDLVKLVEAEQRELDDGIVCERTPSPSRSLSEGCDTPDFVVGEFSESDPAI